MSSPQEGVDDHPGPSNATVKRIVVVGIVSGSSCLTQFDSASHFEFPSQAAISVGLFIPLYFARKRAGSPEEVVSSITPAPGPSPAALLGRHVKPKTAPGSSASTPLTPSSLPRRTITNTKVTEEAIEAHHNTPLHIFGAFTIATAVVWAGAGAGVYAIHRATGATTVSSHIPNSALVPTHSRGVSQPQEFSIHARNFIRARLPNLRERLYGTGEEHVELDEETSKWTWPDAEKRLASAYAQGGISQWGSQVLQEMEAEVKLAKSRETPP